MSGGPHSRAALENLLDDPAQSSSALGAVLRAARAPGNPPAAAGLTAAIAAYRTALAAPAQPQPAAVVAAGTTTASARRFRATKLIAAAASVAAVGGVAFAAVTTGQTFSPGTNHPRASDVSSNGDQSSPPPSVSSSPDGTASGSAEGTPTPSLLGLCKAWEAHQDNRGGNGKSQDSAAFRVLISTAGGLGSVDGFCTSLLASASGTPGNSAHPTHPSHPAAPTNTGKPSGTPHGTPQSSHSSGKP